MSQRLNLLVHINAYSDASYSNSPTLNNIKWHQSYAGIDAAEPNGQSIVLQPSDSKSIYDGVVSTSADNTTTFNISLKSGTSSTYVIQHNSGTTPAFKAVRTLGLDATSEVSITKNAKLSILTFSSGTLPSLTSVVVGDELRIAAPFNANNQGKFKIIAKTSTSITIENEIAITEIVTLGTDFPKFKIYSSAGVQVGNSIELKTGFSTVTLGTYEITDVLPDSLEIFSNSSIPQETAIQATISIYKNAKKFVYIESDTEVDVNINSSMNFKIKPFILGTSNKPGIFMLNSSIYSIQVTASATQVANLFVASAE